MKPLPLILFLLTLAILPARAQQTAWTVVPNPMTDERWAPGACLLPGGKSALIAGGYSYKRGRCVASIDLFDETSGRFRASHARLTYPRDFVQANPLPDGTVLLSGGYNDVWASLDTAEIYDPKSDTCRLAHGMMNDHRELFQASNLADGTVLLTGGLDLWKRGTVSSAEIYHPNSETFTLTSGPMLHDRFGHAACRLADGRVLVVGGTHWNLRKRESLVLDSAEIYDLKTSLFHEAKGHLLEARDRLTATLLPNGTVLIVGGQGEGGKAVTTAELFDPATEQFTAIASPPLTPRMAHGAITAGAGKVVITGGWDAQLKATTPTAILYEIATGRFTPLPDLPFASHDAAMVAFLDGSVLVAGGKVVTGTKSRSTDEGAMLR